MKWQNKARLQNLVAGLPSWLSYSIHYFIQRNLGNLRHVNPVRDLATGKRIVSYIVEHGGSIESARFLEVGTGRRINIPIALWLCGAARIVSVDLNPYLKESLVLEDIAYMRNHRDEVASLFEDYVHKQLFVKRLHQLLDTDNLESVLKLTGIEYKTPADATRLDLEADSIDYQISRAVFGYIKPEIIERILSEGKRLTGAKGLFVHLIDFSDDFSFSDASISAINFLQFSESQWLRYAGNRYINNNRLRVDDYVALFGKAGLQVLAVDAKVDERCLAELRNGFPLNERFKDKSAETNATVNAWLVAAPKVPE